MNCRIGDLMRQYSNMGPEWDEVTGGHEGDKEISAELYTALVSKCSGEALNVIRGGPEGCGFEAWVRLHRKYSPKTFARQARLTTHVVAPPRAKDLASVETAVSQWEMQTRSFRRRTARNSTTAPRLRFSSRYFRHLFRSRSTTRSSRRRPTRSCGRRCRRSWGTG